jgi:PST family polysaccharide transporter
VLSSHQNNRARFDMTLRDFFTAANLVSFPIFVGLALTSNSLVQVMFTGDWSGTVPLMMVICLTGLAHPSTYVLTAATNAEGRPQLVVTVTIIVLVARLVAALFAQQFGVLAVAAGNAAVYILSLPLFLALARATFGHGWRYYFTESSRVALAALAMAAMVWMAQHYATGLNAILMLALSVTVGVATYLAALRLVAPALLGRALSLVTKRA